MSRFTYALRQGVKFALTLVIGVLAAAGIAYGTLAGVDMLPLVLWAKISLTCLLWVAEVAFFVAFSFEMTN